MKQWMATIVALSLACLLQAQPTVSAEVDANDVLIGDHIQYTLFIGMPRGATVNQIGLDAFAQAEGFEVINMGRLDTVPTEADVLLTQKIILTSFDSGSYYLPEIPVTIQQGGQTETLRTNQIPIKVNTLPVSADTTALQPIKPIIEEPLNLQDVAPYLGGILGLVAIILLARWWWIRRNRPPKEAAPPPPPRPAHEIALEKLDTLGQGKWLDQEAYKAFQSELTYILREYLEGRFDIRAMEHTTTEIIRQMDRVHTERDWRSELEEMLSTADLVKFAKATPPRSFHENALETVRQFVEATRPRNEAVIDESENQDA